MTALLDRALGLAMACVDSGQHRNAKVCVRFDPSGFSADVYAGERQLTFSLSRCVTSEAALASLVRELEAEMKARVDEMTLALEVGS